MKKERAWEKPPEQLPLWNHRHLVPQGCTACVFAMKTQANELHTALRLELKNLWVGVEENQKRQRNAVT